MSKPTLNEIGSASSNQDAIADDNFDKIVNNPFPIVDYPTFGDLPDPAINDTCLATVWDGVPGNTPITYQSDGAAWIPIANPITLPSSFLFSGSKPDGVATIITSTPVADPADLVVANGSAAANWSVVLPLVISNDAITTYISMTYGGYEVNEHENHASCELEIDWIAETVFGFLRYNKGGTWAEHASWLFNGSVGFDIAGTKHAGGWPTGAAKVFKCEDEAEVRSILKLPCIDNPALFSGRIWNRR